jgi:hypothetical protein
VSRPPPTNCCYNRSDPTFRFEFTDWISSIVAFQGVTDNLIVHRVLHLSVLRNPLKVKTYVDNLTVKCRA